MPTGEPLDQVGTLWKETSRQVHPLQTLINNAKQSDLTLLVETLISNQEDQTATFIHNNCRTELRNLSRRKGPPNEDEKSDKRRCLRSENERFDFKKKCFYCSGTCIIHTKHPDRNKFEEVRTKDTAIYKQTLNICKIIKNDLAKCIELRLLSINDLVAAEARYHVTCRKNFENPFSVSAPGRPVEHDKKENFEKACIAVENYMELYTVSEFHKPMSEIGKESETEVYSVRMTHSKLKDRYSDALTLATRQVRSNIILLDKVLLKQLPS